MITVFRSDLDSRLRGNDMVLTALIISLRPLRLCGEIHIVKDAK